MEYISQHHLILRNQPFESLHGVTVMLVEPDSEARAFYTNQLQNLAMQVVVLDTLLNMVQNMGTTQVDVVVANPSANVTQGIAQLQEFKKVYPQLPIITMSMTMPDDTLDAIMQSGVSLHINRGLTRPRDLLLALEQVLSMK